jgi:hypothetical protein
MKDDITKSQIELTALNKRYAVTHSPELAASIGQREAKIKILLDSLNKYENALSKDPKYTSTKD